MFGHHASDYPLCLTSRIQGSQCLEIQKDFFQAWIRGDPFFRMVMAYPHVNYQNSELLFTLLLHNKTRPLTAQQMISKLIMFMKLLILKHSRLSIDFCFFSTTTHGYDKCDHLFASKLPWISISKQIGHLQSEQF